jgi:small basic protein
MRTFASSSVKKNCPNNTALLHLLVLVLLVTDTVVGGVRAALSDQQRSERSVAAAAEAFAVEPSERVFEHKRFF